MLHLERSIASTSEIINIKHATHFVFIYSVISRGYLDFFSLFFANCCPVWLSNYSLHESTHTSRFFLSFHSSVIFPNVCHSVAQEWHIFDNCSNIFSFFHISSFHFLRWICSVLVWWFPAGQKPFCICLPFNSCNLLKYEKKIGLFVEKMWSNLSYYFSQVPGCGLQISCLFSCHTSVACSQGKQSKYCMSSKI